MPSNEKSNIVNLLQDYNELPEDNPKRKMPRKKIGEKRKAVEQEDKNPVLRNCCITVFNYNEEVNGKTKLENLRSLESKCGTTDDLRCLIFQSEICPTTLKEHLQGYLEVNKTMRKKAIQELIGCGNDCHMEQRNEDEMNKKGPINYCYQDDKFDKNANIRHAFGDFSIKQGKRSGLTKICDAIKEGKSLKEATQDDPESFVRNHNGIRALINLYDTPRKSNNPAQVKVYYGHAGTGKDRKALCHSNGEDKIHACKIPASEKY